MSKVINNIRDIISVHTTLVRVVVSIVVFICLLSYRSYVTATLFMGNNSDGTLPVNSLLMLMVLPIICSALFRSILTWRFFFMFWIILVLYLAIYIYISKPYKSIWTLILYVPTSLVILCHTEYQHQEISKLILSKNLEIVKVKEEAESNAKEQQNMVSNVTHDLKTVS